MSMLCSLAKLDILDILSALERDGGSRTGRAVMVPEFGRPHLLLAFIVVLQKAAFGGES